MRNVFSRRDFLKASAAAVLAASAAGVLTGCDGGGGEIPSATIGLGEFEVTMTGNMTVTGDEVVGNENANGCFAPRSWATAQVVLWVPPVPRMSTVLSLNSTPCASHR